MKDLISTMAKLGMILFPILLVLLHVIDADHQHGMIKASPYGCKMGPHKKCVGMCSTGPCITTYMDGLNCLCPIGPPRRPTHAKRRGRKPATTGCKMGPGRKCVGRCLSGPCMTTYIDGNHCVCPIG